MTHGAGTHPTRGAQLRGIRVPLPTPAPSPDEGSWERRDPGRAPATGAIALAGATTTSCLRRAPLPADATPIEQPISRDRRCQSLFTAGRDLVVLARRPLRALRHDVVFPRRCHEACGLEPPQRRINGAAHDGSPGRSTAAPPSPRTSVSITTLVAFYIGSNQRATSAAIHLPDAAGESHELPGRRPPEQLQSCALPRRGAYSGA